VIHVEYELLQHYLQLKFDNATWLRIKFSFDQNKNRSVILERYSSMVLAIMFHGKIDIKNLVNRNKSYFLFEMNILPA
jgi:hypothetical protein